MLNAFFGFPGVSKNTQSLFLKDDKINYEHEVKYQIEKFITDCKSGNLKSVVETLSSSHFKILLKSKLIFRENHPLYLAVLSKHFGIVKTLVSHGVEIQISSMKTTVLHFAVCVDNFEILRYLLLHSSSQEINFRDKEGKTPLYKAVEQGNQASIKLLIDVGGDAEIGDHNNIKPLDIILQKKEIPQNIKNNIVAILINSIQAKCDKMTFMLRQHRFRAHCSFSFGSILENLLFTYASTPAGQERLHQVIAKSLKSKKIIEYANKHTFGK